MDWKIVLFLILSPILVPLILALALAYTIVGKILSAKNLTPIISITILIGLAAATAVENSFNPVFQSVFWDGCIFSAGAAFLSVVVTNMEARASTFFTIVSSLSATVYNIVKAAITTAPVARLERAALVFSIGVPLVVVLTVLRTWRHASPQGAAEASARIIRIMCTQPFEDRIVEGLYTIYMGGAQPPSRIPRNNTTCLKRCSSMSALTPPASPSAKPSTGAGAGNASTSIPSAPSSAIPSPTNSTMPLMSTVSASASSSTFPPTMTALSKKSKIPLVMCHGFMSGAAMYMNNLDFFAAHYEVYAIDWLGYAASDRPYFWPRSTRETEDFFLYSLEKWRIAHGLDSFILMGHSMGGYLAGVYALRYPQRVRHLILVSPGAIPPKPEEKVAHATAPAPPPSSTKSPTPRQLPQWLWGFLRWGWDAGITPGMLHRFLGPFGPWIAHRGIQARASRWLLKRPFPAECMQALGDYFYHATAASGSGEHALRYIFAPGAWGRDPLGPRLVAAAAAAVTARNNPITAAAAVPSSATDTQVTAVHRPNPLYLAPHVEAVELVSAGAGALPTAVTAAPPAQAVASATAVASKPAKASGTILDFGIHMLYGTRDWMSSPSAGDVCGQLRQHGIRATMELISDAGHHLYLENYDDFNNAVLKELRHVGLAPAVSASPASGASGASGVAGPSAVAFAAAVATS